MCNNPKLDIVNMNAYIKFGEILSICSQDIERERNYGENQGPKLPYTSAIMTCSNPKLHLVNINAYKKIGEIMSICSQDIEQKRNVGLNEVP